MTLSTLGRFVPGEWLRIAEGTAELTAAIVLAPGQSLTLGRDVRTVRLAGGPTPSDAASIYTGPDGSPCVGSPWARSTRAPGRPCPPAPATRSSW